MPNELVSGAGAEAAKSDRRSFATRRIRWGVIGSGGIARRRTVPEGILNAVNAELVVVCGQNQARNAELAASWGAKAAESVEALVQHDIDAIYIATPPAMHLAQARVCAAAGKHVLCEKPLGLCVEDAAMMQEVCSRSGVLLGTALMMRFHAQHVAARDLVRDGRLGKPVFARAQLSCWYPPIKDAWRQGWQTGGGGALMDLGGHCLDLVEMFFGPAAELSCIVSRTIQDYPVEDSAIVSLRFASGALGVVDTFFCIPDESSRNALELYGSKGSIIARGTIGQGELGEMVASLPPAEGEYDARQQRVVQRSVPITPVPVNTYRAEIEEFGEAIINGRQPANDGAAGLRSQRLLAACYESARLGRTVAIA